MGDVEVYFVLGSDCEVPGRRDSRSLPLPVLYRLANADLNHNDRQTNKVCRTFWLLPFESSAKRKWVAFVTFLPQSVSYQSEG